MKFKNYIEAQSGIKDSADSPGTLDQVLTSTATGVAWVDPSTISAEAATLVVIECKNTSGATITKGTPVYQTGTVGATDVIEIAPADALISAGSQPAIGLLQTTLNNNGFGKVVITGEFLNFTTDPIDGVTPTTGDKVFLKSGGGLTLTKPTGAENGIQNLGLIGKVSGGNAGSITVSSIMRTNDVPNLPTGKIWVGDGNTIVSDTVFLDEPNGRMGIGTTSPRGILDVVGNTDNNTNFLTIQDDDTSASSSRPSIRFRSNTAQIGQIVGLNGRMRFSSGATEDSMIEILDSGNVGIGTTNPIEKLDVVGRIRGERFRTTTGGSASFAAYYFLGDADTGTFQPANNTFGITTAGSERMRIDSSGNVGIGTTSNSADETNNGIPKLQVTTATALLGEFPLAARFTTASDAGDNSGVSVLINSGNDRGLMISAGRAVGNKSRATLNLVSFDGTELVDGLSLYMPNTGSTGATTGTNVGIGTTSPSEKLDVAGNIKLSGVLYVGSRGIYQAQNTDVDGLELVANASINLYRAAFFDYVIQKQGNVRAGTVFACNDGGSVEYTETSTNDIGDTSDVVLSVDISGTNMRLLADAATSGWSVKSLIRAI